MKDPIPSAVYDEKVGKWKSTINDNTLTMPGTRVPMYAPTPKVALGRAVQYLKMFGW